MRFRAIGIAGCTAVILAAPALALAAEASVGEVEYDQKCVMCHGLRGKGDGWLSEHLKSGAPALVRLKKDNGGVFPFERIYQVIDGRREVRLHGPRDMPVWGSIYRSAAAKSYNPNAGQSFVDEGVVRARVLALVEYISTLQE